METIARNPDVKLDAETVPDGFCLIEGKQLMITARAQGIPYGLATKRTPCGNSSRIETVGLVIRIEHKKQMLEAIERKADRQQYK